MSSDSTFKNSSSKNKASMLKELESIKSLLLEDDAIPLLHPEDDIPLLQADDHADADEFDSIPTLDQSDDFDIPTLSDSFNQSHHTREQGDFFTPAYKEPLAKANGENPFLPQHIRERLHGNNPIPNFDYDVVNAIAKKNSTSTAQPTRASKESINARQELIDQLITTILPEIERDLKNKLENMTRDELENLLK